MIGTLTSAPGGPPTTPDAIELQAQLADMRDRGVTAVAMEVSSHALAQSRVEGTEFAVAVFTNLTRDHLDYHGSMQAYGEAKARLFDARGVKHRIVNVDDAFGQDLARRFPDSITYGTVGGGRSAAGGMSLIASKIALSDAGVRFHVESEWGSGEVRAGALGAFNVSNLLAVTATLIAAGLSFDEAVNAIASLDPVPGRLEKVGGGSMPLVVVDYAHTPDALEKALEALRPAVAAGHRLSCVFGCGGDRDPGKRPLMGAVATRLADHVVVTSDNPRSEEPAVIIGQVMAGARGAEAIEDRQVAIFDAVHHATPGDVVLVAGKGHETYQEIAGVRHPFDDREVARAALADWQRGAR
jgi:UDP-N-acetylmuramoyl-L-alanyl-D-glutamate--2,6-diaminopimelate ligase